MSGTSRNAKDGGNESGGNDNSEEVKIRGKISQMFYKGKLIYPAPPPEPPPEPPVPKQKNKYVIVPVKDKNSVVEFIKIPLMKAEKKLKAKTAGTVQINRLNPDGNEIKTEKFPLWVIRKECLMPTCKAKTSKTPSAEDSLLEECFWEDKSKEKKQSCVSRADSHAKRDSVEYVYKRASKDKGKRSSKDKRCSKDKRESRDKRSSKDDNSPSVSSAGRVSRCRRKSKDSNTSKDKKKIKIKRKKSRKDTDCSRKESDSRRGTE